MRSLPAFSLPALLLLVPAAAPAGKASDQVVLAPDGWFRFKSGELFVPLGGFHGNFLPLSRIHLSPEELAKVGPRIWSDQKTDGQGHVDLSDASGQTLHRWFRLLAGHGVTAIRLFARARAGGDVLDLCGKLHPELKQVFHRTFAAARPYRIRFLLQILPEPPATCYMSPSFVPAYVLPRYSREELANLTAAQKRFIVGQKSVTRRQFFTDPDVLACQKLYLEQALDWVATEPQIFALEIYNEQGCPWEDDEIRWSSEIVRTIKKRLPAMPVTLSHPGHGVTAYDPLKWSQGAGVDFYSSHMYSGASGDSPGIDFATVSAATGLIIGAGIVNFPGEWGIFDSPVPTDLKRFSHRDAIWLSLLAGQPGFLQWTYEFPDEYHWPAKVIKALPKGFSPGRPEVEVEIGDTYRRFHTDTRYSAYAPDELFSSSRLRRQKESDPNIQKIFAAYKRSLDIGVPIAFTMGRSNALSLDEFAARDAGSLPRPIRAIGGYQMTYLKDAKSPFWIAYFRKRKVQGFGNHFVGVPAEAPLEINFDLPAGRYHARLVDLNVGKLASSTVGAKDSIQVSQGTSHDYVLLLTPE